MTFNQQRKLSAVELPITRWRNAEPTRTTDALAVESPLTLRIGGATVAVLMRTPGHDRELAAGWLLSEGIIETPGDLLDLTACSSGDGSGDVLEAHLARRVRFDAAKHQRPTLTNASCGLCSATSIARALRDRPPLRDRTRISPAQLGQLPGALADAQPTFQRTGGLHACALFRSDGTLLALREDIGRHNAMDKLLGWAWQNDRWPLHKTVALLSGRASFEMLQKARVADIPIVAAISAPSSLAVQFADAAGQTLVGFLRGNTFNVYTHPRRIAGV